MNRSLWIFPFALLVALSAGAAEPEGFGDLRWGDPVPRGWRLRQSGESQICSKSSWGATFGSARLEKVEYEFEAGRLIGVALFLKERSGFLAAKKELESRFETSGILTRVSPASESYHWNGKAIFADLYYLGEGLSPVLFLSWEPEPGVKGSPGASLAPAQERRLQHRLRLCAQVAEALNKIIAAAEKRVSDLDMSYDAAQKSSAGCGGRPDQNPARDRITREQQTTCSERQNAETERGRLQKEMDRLEAELEALRAARAAAAQSPPPPIS